MRLVIITHQLSRTGASIALFNKILHELRYAYDDISVVSLSGGELHALYASVCNRVIVLDQLIRLVGLISRFLRQSNLCTILTCVLRVCSDDHIFVNTVVPLRFCSGCAALGSRWSVWVHELELNALSNAGANWSQDMPNAYFIAASEPVRKYLSGKSVKVYRDLVLPVSRRSLAVCNCSVSNKRYVLGVGTPTWQKGTDYFLDVAKKCESNANLRFVWLGGKRGTFEFESFVTDATRLGISNIDFVPSVEDLKDWYCMSVAVLVLSREESFGLPVIEAGLHNVPSVVWEGSDGPSWIVSHVGGYAVRYGDTRAVSELLMEISAGSNSGLHVNLAEQCLSFAHDSALLAQVLSEP